MQGSESIIFSSNALKKSVKLSIETSMTEIKPVVMKKHEFEYRKETLLVAFFGYFGF